jgi:predicted NAD/FAD-binding protein
MVAPQQQKLRITGPVAVTANRLADGVVVWRTADRGWSRAITDAAVVTTSEEALALLHEAERDGINAVSCYVAHVAVDGEGRAQPQNLRERIRTEGPTVALPGQV